MSKLSASELNFTRETSAEDLPPGASYSRETCDLHMKIGSDSLSSFTLSLSTCLSDSLPPKYSHRGEGHYTELSGVFYASLTEENCFRLSFLRKEAGKMAKGGEKSLWKSSSSWKEGEVQIKAEMQTGLDNKLTLFIDDATAQKIGVSDSIKPGPFVLQQC